MAFNRFATQAANRMGTWSNVMIQPQAALPMITSITTPVAIPASTIASLNRAQSRSL